MKIFPVNRNKKLFLERSFGERCSTYLEVGGFRLMLLLEVVKKANKSRLGRQFNFFFLRNKKGQKKKFI